MKLYSVTFSLIAESNRVILGLPAEACTITKIVRADSITKALEILHLGPDCYKVEGTLVSGGIVG